MLSARALKKNYISSKGMETRALNGVNLDFPEKGMVFIVGKSGCGKSTLLNILGGLDRPDSGEIIVDGKSSRDFAPEDFDSYRNKLVGFVFQEFNNIDKLTVGDNVALALNLQGLIADREKILEALRLFDLDTCIDKYPCELSGGQRQRAAIARAIVKDPKYLFADEPTGSLDSKTGRQVLDALKHLSKSRLVVIVTHDTDSALIYADRIIELADGEIAGDKVKNRPVELSFIKEAYTKQTELAFSDFKGIEKNDAETFVPQKLKTTPKSIFSLIAASLSKSKLRTLFVVIITVFTLTMFGIIVSASQYDGSAVTANNFDMLDIKTAALINNKITYD